MRTKGRITSWNDEKGYGFITPLTGGKQVFFHISALGNRNRRPEVNEVISYSVSKDARGRPCAANATLAGDKLVAKAARKSNTVAILLAVLFLAAIGVATLGGDLSMALLIAYVVMSFVTYIAYAIDKSAAQKGRWRTTEGTLLMLGLAGGWPGGLIAQETLRHKSKKASFRVQFWITVMMNCAALVWLNTEVGREIVLGFFS